jgi:epoxide hydrolase-like predicted phosphatase
MYKAIGFDYGGVLNNSKPIMPGIAEITGMSVDEIRNYYLQHNHLANAGNMSYEDLWTKVMTDLGHADKAERVVDHLHKQHTIEMNQDMLALLDELRAQGYKTGLLSNNTKENGAKLRAEGLDKYFDVFIISGEVGLQKPSPEIFHLLCKELEVSPEELIFTDDSPSSLRQADEIGYYPILFKNYAQFRAELVVLKVIEK